MEEALEECSKVIYEEMRRYSGYCHSGRCDKEDLHHSAIVGFTEAYKRFDNSRDTDFPAYARLWIRGEIHKCVNGDKTIQVSKDVIRENRRIEATKDILRQKLMREPTLQEIALVLEKEEYEIEQIIQQVKRSNVQSLDALREQEIDYYDRLGNNDPAMQDDYQFIMDEIKKLSPNERKIFCDRYIEGLSQQETSQSLGMSQAKVSRIEGKVKQKIISNYYM